MGDPKRTYLTGVSMGGYGSWYLASTHPGKFAAVVPICGGIVPPANVLEAQPLLARDTYPENAKSAGRAALSTVGWIAGLAANAAPRVIGGEPEAYGGETAAPDSLHWSNWGRALDRVDANPAPVPQQATTV